MGRARPFSFLRESVVNHIHQKPHPDAVLVRTTTGEIMKYPEGRERDVAEDVADARAQGYCIAVPAVKTASGRRVHISIDSQVGGLTGLEKVLRGQRRVGKGEDTTYVPSTMLASDYAKLPDADKKALLETKERKADPRDAEIAALKAELARLAQANAPKGK